MRTSWASPNSPSPATIQRQPRAILPPRTDTKIFKAVRTHAPTTTKTSVTIYSYVTGAIEMRFSTDGTSWPKNWTRYAATKQYNFDSAKVYGTKTVYAQYRDASGNVIMLQDSIEYVKK